MATSDPAEHLPQKKRNHTMVRQHVAICFATIYKGNKTNCKNQPFGKFAFVGSDA